MPNHDMLIVQKAYDFSKWLLLHTGKFPKSYRFSIAVRIENAVLEFTELVALANVRHEKLPFLEQADSRKPLKARRAGRFDTAFGLLSVRVSGRQSGLSAGRKPLSKRQRNAREYYYLMLSNAESNRSPGMRFCWLCSCFFGYICGK